ncbi:hypothetical protein VTJ83DRAFT_4521 [Remersonia thermophila]|uniref:C2H2-type domain-containing protein n=1 Tax=Remersonia thermophila TaxID=72144 RepID=A0ABR4DB37_9PEZI
MPASRMMPGPRGRSPASRRAALKLGGDAPLRIPYRLRKDADSPRKTAAADLDTAAARCHDSDSASTPVPAAADALSLSGTTPPTSPTMASFPGGAKSMTPESKPSRPQLVLIDSQGKVTAASGRHDDSFRKHHRGMASIDSIISSTTCVNTQSECSRSESRLSRDIRMGPEEEDDGGGDDDEEGRLSSVPRPLPPKKKISSPQLAPPGRLGHVSAAPSVNGSSDGDDVEEEDEEAKLVNEISSWVLRNTFGKDVDDCPAPLLIWDCTYRYLQELWTASQGGSLGYVQGTVGDGTPSPRYGGSPGSGNNDQPPSGQPGKGKRKADGSGSDDGSGLGGRRGSQGDDDRDVSPASQAYSSKGMTNFSCPYRKRNPLRFNVRDYYVCATHSFADMSQLKKHIRAHHPPVQRNAGPFLCPRCCQGFSSKNALDSHLRQLDVCHVSFDSGGADPEDGITQKIIASLEARSHKAKIDNWNSLWRLLFPVDQVIPDPVFVPVMEVFDFISESKKFLTTLKDLLDLQYRHVLEGATHAMDIDVKIRQGLERSTSSIYTWIETVVQDWEQRISGTMSLFTSSAIRRAASNDSWTSTPQLPPSPAPTPTVVAGSVGAATTSTGSESPGATAPAVARPPPANRRRTNPPPKRVKRPEILPKASVPTQIPVPIQRARTPQSQSRLPGSTLRPSPQVLPGQSVHSMPSTTTQALQPSPQYPAASWDHTTVAVSGAYSVPYTSPTEVFQHPAMTPTHYTSIHTSPLEVASSYLGSEQQAASMSPEGMHRNEMDTRPQTATTLNANRFTLSTATPRSSLASLSWIRDEHRDSSQTLVEAHPPGRCGNMYCPSCSKPLAEDLVGQPSPVGMHPVTGAPQQHPAFHTAGAGQRGPFHTSPISAEVHGLSDQVEWSFHAAGGMHGAGGEAMFGGGHHGPREGF